MWFFRWNQLPNKTNRKDRDMSHFERLALRGLWIIIRLLLKIGNLNSGTNEIVWAGVVAKALDDDNLRDI